MSNTNDLISNALESYDLHVDKYESFLKKVSYYILHVDTDEVEMTIYQYISFYDKNKTLLHKSTYEVLGIFDPIGSIWIWAWATPYLDKNMTRISRKILNYGIDLSSTNDFLKSELITSRFKISNPIQIELHCSIASYLGKKQIIIGIIPDKEKQVDEYFTYVYKEVPTQKIYYIFLEDLPIV
jgi:hypothetical protein